MSVSKRIITFLCSFAIVISSVSVTFVAHANIFEDGEILDDIWTWLSGGTSDGGATDRDYEFEVVTPIGSASFSSTLPQKYYTTPTESVEDKYGNVTNYYRGGDTTTTKIIDSYNHTFNTIHNTTNNTNNYSANVKLSDFLNTYTTNNNNYTYNTEYKSWYYDNTSNTMNYDASQTYYNTDNSRYYISIDNSTDEYYLVDVQYSPTFVTVNYTYNNIDNSTTYGDVTNVYYFELTDGRNSSTLSVDEVAGLALAYDVVNYELVTDDPNTLSLQHFDGDYTDSSAYGQTFYSENRSTNYVDSGEFGQAVTLVQGSVAGVTIPDLWLNQNISIEFRAYTTATSNKFILYSGNVPLIAWQMYDGFTIKTASQSYITADSDLPAYFSEIPRLASGYSQQYVHNGLWEYSCGPSGSSQSPGYAAFYDPSTFMNNSVGEPYARRVSYHNISSTLASVNTWHSWKISIIGDTWYWFLDGDLLSTTTHDRLDSDLIQFFSQTGTWYLDELRITTGDMVSSDVYNPSSAPFDTNKVLALPSELVANTIYVRHSTPVNGWRIGGVRPSNPTTGFFYIPLHSDYTGGQAQLYDGSNWVDVDAMVYDGTSVTSVVGFTFTPMGEASDVNTDLKEPGSEDEGDSSCSHTWEETSRIDATCTGVGSVTYTCSECAATKTENLSKLNHTWEVKQAVQTTYDESGNILTEGFTIYRCSVCGEEYKDTDGSGPPMSDSSDDAGDGSWFTDLLTKIGDFFGTTIGGLLNLVGSVINSVLDSLINLVSSALARLTEVVDLFGSFGESISSLWSWLPSEIVTVLVAGVTILIFAAVIKIFL